MALKDSFRQVGRLTSHGYRGLAAALLALAVVALVAGVLIGRGGEQQPERVPEASRADLRQRVSFLSRIVPTRSRPQRRDPTAPDVARSVQELARRLPVERKVAQLFLLGFRGTDLTANVFRQLRRLDLGGIVIDRSNYSGPSLLGQLGGEAVVVSRQARRVPPFVMASQEGGEFNSFPDLPPAHAAADLSSSREGGREAAQAASALRGLNVTGVLGPSIDVGTESGPALGARVFSDQPRQVASFADAVTRAYRRGFVFSSPSHFPGLGSADVSTEEGPATVGLSAGELEQRDLVPFRAAIQAGAPAITLSHAVYALDDYTVPGSLSRKVITGLLRGKLHFKGVAITDDLADPPIASFASLPDAAVSAVRAGADMLYISGPAGDQRAAYVEVLRAVRRGKISRRRLDEAVLRILEAKRNYRLIR
jgi:beta-N-acetylhexosaminidase